MDKSKPVNAAIGCVRNDLAGLEHPHVRTRGEYRGVAPSEHITERGVLGDIPDHQGVVQGLRVRSDRDQIDKHPLPGLLWALPSIHLQGLEVSHRASPLDHHVCPQAGRDKCHEHGSPHALHAALAALAALARVRWATYHRIQTALARGR